MMKKLSISLFAFPLLFAAACSQATPPAPKTEARPADGTIKTEMMKSEDIKKVSLAETNAEIRNINVGTRTITLKHDEIKNVGMMAMTMSFPVKDGIALDKLKAGDKIRFTADMVKSTLTVMSIELMK